MVPYEPFLPNAFSPILLRHRGYTLCGNIFIFWYIYIKRIFLLMQMGGGVFPGCFVLFCFVILEKGMQMMHSIPFLADCCRYFLEFSYVLSWKSRCGGYVMQEFSRYTGEYTTGCFFFASCRMGPRGHTAPPPLFWKMNAIFTIWGDWYLSKTVEVHLRASYLSDSGIFLVTFEEILREEFHQSCKRKSKGLQRKPFWKRLQMMLSDTIFLWQIASSCLYVHVSLIHH